MLPSASRISRVDRSTCWHAGGKGQSGLQLVRGHTGGGLGADRAAICVIARTPTCALKPRTGADSQTLLS